MLGRSYPKHRLASRVTPRTQVLCPMQDQSFLLNPSILICMKGINLTLNRCSVDSALRGDGERSEGIHILRTQKTTEV